MSSLPPIDGLATSSLPTNQLHRFWELSVDRDQDRCLRRKHSTLRHSISERKFLGFSPGRVSFSNDFAAVHRPIPCGAHGWAKKVGKQNEHAEIADRGRRGS
jgi:hypothetical protein